jgi:hypothetical protein
MKKPGKRKRPKSHIFRGSRYKIVWHKPKPGKLDPKNHERWGTCSAPRAKGKRIVIWPKLKDHNLLITLLDESIHACAWDLDNDSVGEISSDIGRFLWRNGLRFS